MESGSFFVYRMQMKHIVEPLFVSHCILVQYCFLSFVSIILRHLCPVHQVRAWNPDTEDNMQTSKDCVKMCLEKNPACKAVEWWANGLHECFECFDPSLMADFTDTDDESYPPHVLVRPRIAAPTIATPRTKATGELPFQVRNSRN